MAREVVSVREIARITGVSISTVSRVLNHSGNVSEETRQKVQKVIDEYNYVPNISARNVFSKHSRSIAMFVLDIYNPFFAALIKELSSLAITNDYAFLICDTENDPDIEKKYIDYCMGIRTKGIIITEGHSSALCEHIMPSTNLVFHDRFYSSQFSSVYCDNKKGISLAVDYLYNLNHRKFAFIGYSPNIRSSSERKKAFVNALKEKGITVTDDYIIKGSLTFESGASALDVICSLPEKPTAIICCNDQIAKGFIVKASSINMKIPEDFSVVGFDGVDNDKFYPKLTTVKQNIPLIAQKLFEFATEGAQDGEGYMTDVSFVVGNSCRKRPDME